MKIPHEFMRFIQIYETYEREHADAWKIFKERYIEGCIHYIENAMSGDKSYIRQPIAEALAVFENIKVSTFLTILFDYVFNVTKPRQELPKYNINIEVILQSHYTMTALENNFYLKWENELNKLNIFHSAHSLDNAIEALFKYLNTIWHGLFGNTLGLSRNFYEAKRLLKPVISEQEILRNNARKGGLNNERAESLRIAKKRAYELYQQDTFTSFNAAAKAILPRLRKEGLIRYLDGQEESQKRTVRRWLKKHFEPQVQLCAQKINT
jgi:hypothetical protein